MRNSHFVVVGLGPVGRSMAGALEDAGYKPVALVGRGRPIEHTLARKIGARLLAEFPEDIDKIDFVLLALPTSKITDYAAALAKRNLPWERLTILHASGSYGAGPLAPLAKLGAGVAAMHPYQTFPKRQTAVNLQGVTYGITGNRRGAAVARRVARDLGGKPLSLREADRMLYHLSAIVACTFMAANMDMAVAVLKSLGFAERRALETVLPITRETIRNIGELGIRAAMTGPQTRGDTALIRRHLKELKERVPELADVYSSVSAYMLKHGRDRKQGSRS